ncbi:hypothetical protein EU508_00120 [Pseudoalteromonas fuliginea]|uniref:Uncharacterized protein n=1 Tax=Pseudoalteromonas fuliginea TaxID=1872678 RepID=A0AB73BLZ7_9GAMM|nr:hypothetical protein [Pseudoalteromonas fuliginea]KAA1166176.1 hypothetical protein EU508_00120 [Pseudoalteromonas fuliginea]
MKSKTKCKIIMISGCLLGALMWGEQADFVWGGAIAIPLIIALSLFLDLIFVFIKQDDSKTSLNPGNINTKANYDYYVEPCQLCIERDNPEQRHLIDDCGWCNDNDTFYMSSNDYSGEIIKLMEK